MRLETQIHLPEDLPGKIINLVSVKQVCLRTARKLTMEVQEKTILLLLLWFLLGSHVFVCSGTVLVDVPARTMRDIMLVQVMARFQTPKSKCHISVVPKLGYFCVGVLEVVSESPASTLSQFF